MGNQGGKALKWLPAHFNYEKRNTPKSERERPSTLRDWSPCSPHSAERRVAVKAGCKPVHFSLDGCPLSCYFSGSVATTSDTLSTSRSVGRGTGASYTPSLLLKPDLCLRLYATQAQPCFPAAPKPLPSPAATAFSRQTPTERITHYTCFAKSCAKWGRCPLWKPPQEKAVRYPSTGRIPPFLVIQPSGCIG